MNDDYPSVSVIIPCRNEENYIRKCLDSIVACSYPKEQLSVFVCDGVSTDDTQNIVQNYSEKHGFISLLINERKTTQYALNMGIKASDAQIKIILGAHAEIYPDFIERCVDVFKLDNSIGCAGGIIQNISENKTSEVIASAMASPFGVGNAHFRTGEKEGYVDTVAFGAYKNEVFEKAGYFDEDLIRNQDDEFNYRIIQKGYKIYLSKKIKSKYYVRASFKKLFRQYYQYGYWKVYVNTKHKTVTTVRQLIPFLFVSFLILGLGFSFLSLVFLFLYLSAIALYVFLAFFFAFKRQKNMDKVLATIYCFLILHFSYGMGYLEGIINFLVLNRKPSTVKSSLSR